MNTKFFLTLLLLFLVMAVLTACTPVEGVFDVEIQPASEIEGAEETETPVTTNPVDEAKPVALAILRGSVYDRKALVQYTTTTCTTADGLGGPPKCLASETDGAEITAFPLGGPESTFVRPTEIDRSLEFSVKGLYAIYRVQSANQPGEFPVGEYALVFDRDENDYPLPIIAFVQDGKLVGLDFKTGFYPEDMVKALPLSDIVVAPTEVENWLGQTELLSQTTASEDGAWMATTIVVYQPNGGGQLYRNLTINEVEGSTSWTVVDEWLPDIGVGFASPFPLYWSESNPVVYWTNTPTPDGCAIFANGYDLHKLDLTTGESTQLIKEGGLWLAVSPDETEVAFVNGTNLTVHTFATGEERTVALPEGQAGQIVWSAYSQQLVLTIADTPCGDPALNTFSVVRVDTITMNTVTLIDHDPRLFSTMDWSATGSVLLADKDGLYWQMDPETGEVWKESGMTGSSTSQKFEN